VDTVTIVLVPAPDQAVPDRADTWSRPFWLTFVVCLAAYVGCTFALAQTEGDDRS
jgi:hypothetical protein